VNINTHLSFYNELRYGILATYLQGKSSMLSAYREAPHCTVAAKHENTCAYRGDNGLKCLVGHLIADDKVAEALYQGSDLHANVRAMHAAFGRYLDEDECELVVELQSAHDDLADEKDIVEWRLKFKEQVDEALTSAGFPPMTWPLGLIV
jgi:hypothetical protein